MLSSYFIIVILNDRCNGIDNSIYWSILDRIIE